MSQTPARSATAAPLRLGILGCANIAKQFARDVAPSPQIQLVSVASRDLAKAQAFAQQYGLPKAHGSYEALLQDPDIEAVYIPLPNTMHADWAIRAAQMGKHILCEKPLTLTRASAKAMFDVARTHQVMLLEAYPYYFQPQTGDMLQLLHSGAIGEVRMVQASFGFMLPDNPQNIRLNPDLGGGALLDAGSYATSFIRLVMGCAPQRVIATSQWTASGVDISTTGLLAFDGDRMATLSCAMNTANHRRGTVCGTAGTIETEYLNHTSTQDTGHPYGYLPSQLRVRRGTANTVAFEPVTSDVGSGFRFAAEAFAQKVRAGDQAAIDRAAQASLDIAATLEALRTSAKTGQWVDVERG
jgi:predicted dehydrogenase